MAKEAGVPEAPRKFRVLHGAVAGTARSKKGETIDHDYYGGQIVREDQLEGNAAEYCALGAIAPIEDPSEAEAPAEPAQE
jgi:hypothetical protein